MKKSLILFAFLVASVSLVAQSRSYIGGSLDGGIIINSKQQLDKSIGLGGTLTYAISADFLGDNSNYVTINLKGLNNPYGDGKFISSVLNNKNDGLNYAALLVGYRMVEVDYETGMYFEPRVGFVQAASYSGFMMSPKVGYALGNWDLSAFSDIAIGQQKNNLNETTIFSLGLSLGYNFKLFKGM